LAGLGTLPSPRLILFGERKHRALLSDGIAVWRQWEVLGCVIPCDAVGSHPLARGLRDPLGLVSTSTSLLW